MLPSSSSFLPFLPSSRLTHPSTLRFSPSGGQRAPAATAGPDLGDDAFLAKIDRLRATNVGALVPLPQVVVVGDQSSGKSAALESLTGFAFPRAATLCTRYATQLSCIRAPAPPRTVVSIQPRPDADDGLRARLQAFRHELDGLDDLSLAQVFHKANVAMGIRMDGDTGDGLAAFSEDILKIDIYGPDQSHLTLIDVPGIFRIPTPGLTTDADIQLVRTMVQRYMENPRTIILAVLPCNVDVANQEILRLAAAADPGGLRTMGVLTKPDLATERATQDAVLALVRGQRNALQLGYCVLRNRGADDRTSTPAARRAAEEAFFQAPPWAAVQDEGLAALGTDALRARLRGLVLDLAQRALPHVRADVAARRRACAAQLAALGPPRADEAAQRQHLVAIAARAQDVTKSALYGFYAGGGDDGDALFAGRPALRLITRVTRLNERFAATFWKRGHVQHFRGGGGTYHFSETSESDDEGDGDGDGDGGSHESPLLDAAPDDEELSDVADLGYTCPQPKPGPLTDLIRDVYLTTRGPELGTFSGAVLACVFTRLTAKWEPLALAHAGRAVVLVHAYLRQLLAALCPDRAVRDRLWDGLLRDGLRARYRAALAHARFLLRVERHGLPLTLHPGFETAVQRRRRARLVDAVARQAQTMKPPGGQPAPFVSVDALRTLSIAAAAAADTDPDPHPDNVALVCADLLDTVESYYAVARARFVDTLCQHVVLHLLLFGPDSPLALLAPGRVLQLSAAQLDAIAGEDAATRNQRRVLGRQLASLDEAVDVLRS